MPDFGTRRRIKRPALHAGVLERGIFSKEEKAFRALPLTSYGEDSNVDTNIHVVSERTLSNSHR